MKNFISILLIVLGAGEAFSADVCNRSLVVQKAIQEKIYEASQYKNSTKKIPPIFKDCSEVSDEDLAAITDLFIYQASNASKLQKDDLKGLFSLRRLNMSWFAAEHLPTGYLDDLKELREFHVGYGNGIHAGGEGLVSLEPDIFKNNSELVLIDIGNNKFETLPEGIFTHLKKLLVVKVNYNFKTPTGASGDYFLKGLVKNIFATTQTQLGLYRPDDQYYERYPLNPAPDFKNDSHKPCGQAGTTEDRARDCALVKKVEGTDGKIYYWRLISVSNLGYETWQDMFTKLLWSDVSGSYLAVARLKEAGSDNPKSYLCVPRDKESLAARNINPDKWRLPSEADFLSAQSRGMYEALPRIFGDFNKYQTNYVLAEPVKWGYDNRHHGGSYVWMNWKGFAPVTALEFFYAGATYPSLNPRYPYLLEPDTSMSARSWAVKINYRCVGDVVID